MAFLHRTYQSCPAFNPWLAAMSFLLFSLPAVQAQSDKPYHLNGNAVQEDCNCYTLTNDTQNQSGSVWNINKIDLSEPFDFHFNVFLGCRDSDGADGIAFVLQPISTSIGSTGQGLGIQGVSPSLVVAIDTYTNSDFGDPAYDHLAIHLNGDLNHNSANNIAGPVKALADNDNIEDCNWHIIRISWDPTASVITVYMDGKERVQTTINLVQQVFNGDPKVFWGFSGATGNATNHQRFCTSLNPSFSIADNQITCYPAPIQFQDSSASFGEIVKWYWDFGDGTTDTVQNPAPHHYPAPGNYSVSLSIVGNDGCLSDSFQQQVIAGSKPLADFNFANPLFCDNRLIPLNDLSSVEFGSIQSWNWSVNGSTIADAASPPQLALPPGNHTVALQVKTKEGCISETVEKSIAVQPHPEITMVEALDACRKEPVLFEAVNNNSNIPVQSWHWNFGDSSTADAASVSHVFSEGGKYPVSVYAISATGCSSDTLEQEVSIFATHAFAGNDTIAAIGQPIQLQATGGDFFQWTPSTGLDNANIPNPVATVQRDMVYIVTASTATAACPTTDSLRIKAYRGPEFYIPNAFTPNRDGLNDVFRFTAAGVGSVRYFRIFNRYGQLVYSSTTAEPGWDGNFNGKRQPSDTYVWMIEGVDYLGNTIRRKGTVTLMR